MKTNKEIIEHLLSKGVKTGECLIWRNKPEEYGSVLINGRQWGVHRLMWAVCNGGIEKLKKGFHICHRCHVRGCFNPAHLYQGTPQNNVDDKVRAGRLNSAVGNVYPNAKLTPDRVRWIRKNCSLEEQRSIGRAIVKYGVSEACVKGVLTGHYWKHIK